MPGMASLRKRLTDLIPELAKFGVVGLIGSVIDLGGADYLHVHMGIGPMVAKAMSITAATLVTYLGSRFWTFRHRVNQALLREGVLFVVLNIIGLGIAEMVIAITTYGLDMKSELAYNGASVVGTGFGTIFRYFAVQEVGVPGGRARHGGGRRGGGGVRDRRPRRDEPGWCGTRRGVRAAVGGARAARGPALRPGLGPGSTWSPPSPRPAALGRFGWSAGSAGCDAGLRRGRGRAGCRGAADGGAGIRRTWPAWP